MSLRVAGVAALPAAALLAWATAGAAGPDGAALYGAKCASCHGADGRADTPVARAVKAPPLRGWSGDGAALVRLVREDPAHRAAGSKLADDEIAALARHLESLAD